MDFGIAGVASITVITYIVGLAVRAGRVRRKWIPVICAACGAVLGVAGRFVIPDFPAQDVISAAAVGIVSGLAATGADQAVKQMSCDREKEETQETQE